MTVRKGSAPHRTPVETAAPTIDGDRLAALRAIVPEAFDETGIDFDKLKLALGGAVDEGKERYGLSWSGKAQSVRQLMLPSRATLVPDRGESINFDTTQHVFIEGENLEVLKLLRKAYAGRVKMIYIDPPYNKDADVIYEDNFEDPLAHYLKNTGQVDEAGNWLTSVTETAGRRHSKWLSMIYPRLLAAADVLHDTGVVLVSIDDHEIHNLRLAMNEVFGEENFVAVIVWKGATDNNPTQIAVEHEYIVCYAKNKGAAEGVWRSHADDVKAMMLAEYGRLKKSQARDPKSLLNEWRRFVRVNGESLVPLTHYTRIDKRGPYTGSRKVHNPKPGGYQYDVIHPVTKKPCTRPANGYRFPKATMDRLIEEKRILYPKDHKGIIQIKEYLEDYDGKLSSVLHLDSRVASNEIEELFGERKVFSFPKPAALLRGVFSFILRDGDIALDFFSGSSASGDAITSLAMRTAQVMRFVMVQLPERTPENSIARKEGFDTIAELGLERVRRVMKREEAALADKLTAAANPVLRQLGVRLFRLSESHYKRWAGTTDQDAAKYIETMALYTDPLLPGWTPEGLLWEVALKAGYPLHSTVEAVKEIKGQTVYRVTDPDKGTSFLACFDKSIAKDLAGRLKLTREDTFVVRDAALDDTLAANLALTCTLRTI